MQHRATLCDYFQGAIRTGQGNNDFLRGATNIPYKTDCSASSEKPVEWKKLIDKG